MTLSVTAVLIVDVDFGCDRIVGALHAGGCGVGCGVGCGCGCGCGCGELPAGYTAASASRSHDNNAAPVGSLLKSTDENMIESVDDVPPAVVCSECRGPRQWPSS